MLAIGHLERRKGAGWNGGCGREKKTEGKDRSDEVRKRLPSCSPAYLCKPPEKYCVISTEGGKTAGECGDGIEKLPMRDAEHQHISLQSRGRKSQDRQFSSPDLSSFFCNVGLEFGSRCVELAQAEYSQGQLKVETMVVLRACAQRLCIRSRLGCAPMDRLVCAQVAMATRSSPNLRSNIDVH